MQSTKVVTAPDGHVYRFVRCDFGWHCEARRSCALLRAVWNRSSRRWMVWSGSTLLAVTSGRSLGSAIERCEQALSAMRWRIHPVDGRYEVRRVGSDAVSASASDYQGAVDALQRLAVL